MLGPTADRTLKSARAALPLPATSFVGREREVGKVSQLLTSARLLSLLGPGGCGKTRLALAVAAEAEYQFVDGVCWVELTQVSNPAFVAPALAKALGVNEQPEVPLTQTLLEKLSSKNILLVLDNCEHLLAECAQVVKALLGISSIKVLTTSREPLGLEGEVRYTVPPLSLPKPGQALAELAQSESVRLFVERAQTIRPEFALTAENAPLVADLCRHLDGLPLAIELASARVNVLSLRQLRERLAGRLDVLGSNTNAEARHQTLRSAIDWSYQLLSPPERLLLQRLSVFASGFTLHTVEAICSWGELESASVLDLLTSLIQKSLVVVESLDGDEARYRLLETIRQYAGEKLETSGARAQTHDHYLDGFSRLVEEIAPRLHQPDQHRWLGWLAREQDNLRVALEWACRQRRAQEGLRLFGALTALWDARGHFREGFHWFGRLLALEEVAQLPLSQRMNAFVGATFMALLAGDTSTAAAWAGEAVRLGTEAGEAGWPQLGFALLGLATAAKVRGDGPTALALLERGIRHERERGTGVTRVIYFGLFVGGMIETDLGQYPQAQRHLEEALEIAVAASDPYSTALVLDALGQLARVRGRPAQAVAHMEEALELFRQSGANRDLPNVERHLAYTCLRQGDPSRALALFRQSLKQQLRRDHRSSIPRGLLGFAAVAAEARWNEASACLQGFVAGQKLGTVNLDSGDTADHLDDLHYRALVRSRLSELEFETAQNKGRAMNLDQAVAYALGLDFQTALEHPNDLTRRERDLVGLIGAGLSNGEIADRLGLSKRTVEKHIANILLKLEFKNRAQIVRWAVEQGLGSASSTNVKS